MYNFRVVNTDLLKGFVMWTGENAALTDNRQNKTCIANNTKKLAVKSVKLIPQKNKQSYR